MYSEDQYNKALAEYDKMGSVTKTIARLGYPVRRQTLYNWIARRKHLPVGQSTFRGVNTPEHPRHPSLELKLAAIHRCFELGEDVQSVSDEIGYSTASIYLWRKKYIQEGCTALMNPSNERKRGELTAGTPVTSEELSRLKAQVQDMQLEIDVLKETINVLKKDPGADRTTLRNVEKAAVVDVLKNKYSLPKLLKVLYFAHSSYYYGKAANRRSDKYASQRKQIGAIYKDNHSCYGYRRIYLALRKSGVRLSEKVIRRLMRQEQLQPAIKRTRAYSSYKGEITPAVPNIMNRHFHAEQPNERWLTDITEFAIPTGKVYLSPMIDCFDGMPVCWRVGVSPNAELVNGMLDDAVSALRTGDHPIVHTDRGCHYRWPGWIDRMNKAGLTRSMSEKGCSPDNSACEGFFGRMKNEMFYGLSWLGISIDGFIQVINDYMVWYREKRIKESLGGYSPLEYRQNLGLA
ncbi:IS3 family transposase [Oscillibacter sp.]|uniref:IS3 family transposase n=1 Tax=Oscillibacter sp. TaxID=1945593 RepID=UPI00289DDA08|nr:IS3 family transposase [Oscillibacter sp.]